MNVRKKAVLTLGGVSMAAALVGLGAAPASAALTYGKLQSTSTGYCLDGNDDGNIYPKACNAGNYQQWAFEAKGGGVYQLKQRATLHCLDAYADGKVRLALCNGGAYQEFTFDYNSYGNRIRSKKWNKCLDGNNATAPAIYTLTCNTGNYQRWHR